MHKIVDPRILMEVKRLMLVSPEDVYRYMEACKDSELLYHLAEILLERKEELIKLALARFTNNGEILERLFKISTDEAIRCAALGNPNLPPLGVFGRMVQPVDKPYQGGKGLTRYSIVSTGKPIFQ